ncbi:hypothetical protein V8C42DRAFT_171245 [Trichoderma barbatum]
MDALGAGYRYAGRPLGTPCSLSANVENVMWQRVIALKTRLGELTVIVSSDNSGSPTLRPIRRVYERSYGPVLVDTVPFDGFLLAVSKPPLIRHRLTISFRAKDRRRHRIKCQAIGELKQLHSRGQHGLMCRICDAHSASVQKGDIILRP